MTRKVDEFVSAHQTEKLLPRREIATLAPPAISASSRISFSTSGRFAATAPPTAADLGRRTASPTTWRGPCTGHQGEWHHIQQALPPRVEESRPRHLKKARVRCDPRPVNVIKGHVIEQNLSQPAQPVVKGGILGIAPPVAQPGSGIEMKLHRRQEVGKLE